MRLGALLLLFVFPLSALGAPRHRPTPTPTPLPTPVTTKGPVEKLGMVCRSKQQDLELRDWISGLMNQVHLAQAENTAAQKTNADTVTTLGMSVKDARALIDECAADKECAKAPLSCWFHRLMKHLFWIAGAAVLLIIGLLVASFFFPALGPIFGFFVSIWKWLLGRFRGS